MSTKTCLNGFCIYFVSGRLAASAAQCCPTKQITLTRCSSNINAILTSATMVVEDGAPFVKQYLGHQAPCRWCAFWCSWIVYNRGGGAVPRVLNSMCWKWAHKHSSMNTILQHLPSKLDEGSNPWNRNYDLGASRQHAHNHVELRASDRRRRVWISVEN